MDKLNNIELYSYNYKKSFNNSNHKLYGMIAQNVEEAIPTAIKIKKMKNGTEIIDDFKTISQNTIITYMIGAIKQLKERDDKNTERIQNLESELLKKKFEDF